MAFVVILRLFCTLMQGAIPLFGSKSLFSHGPCRCLAFNLEKQPPAWFFPGYLTPFEAKFGKTGEVIFNIALLIIGTTVALGSLGPEKDGMVRKDVRGHGVFRWETTCGV